MKLVNREVYKNKKVSVFVGSPTFGRSVDIMIDVCLEIWPESGNNHIENNFFYFDDCHPQDQVSTIETFMKNYKDSERTRFIYTNSPYIVQAIIHHSGFDSDNVGIYECERDSDGNVRITDCSGDCRNIFSKMAAALDNIMDVIRDEETRERLRKYKEERNNS